MKQMSTKASNSRCEFSFGNLTFQILVLQTSWLTVHLHVFAWFWDQTQVQFWDPDPPNQLVYSEFAWSWDQIHIDFAKRWTFSKTCWHFHNFVGAGILGPNSILKISLFGSWSYKLPGLECFCMILWLNPDSVWDPYPPNDLVYNVFAWSWG